MKRNCPKCSKILEYKSKSALSCAIKNNSTCRECAYKVRKIVRYKEKNSCEKIFKRNCPKCSKEIWYSTKNSLKIAIKKNSICKSCVVTIRNKKQKGKPISEKAKKSFKNRDYSHFKTEKYKNIAIQNLKKAQSKNTYEWWLEKYGKEIADQKHREWKDKISQNTAGENNPMFGKPSPIGSGNGWCGWYKNWHFRSLLELSYMINVIERFNLKWKNAECKKYAVPYNYKDKYHTYYPDFVINDKYVIDCKPKDLQTSELNLVKKENAIKHFEKLGLKFKFVKCRKLNKEEILSLYNNKLIKFIDRYELKFKEKYL